MPSGKPSHSYGSLEGNDAVSGTEGESERDVEEVAATDVLKYSSLKLTAAVAIAILVITMYLGNSGSTENKPEQLLKSSTKTANEGSSDFFVYKHTVVGRGSENWGSAMKTYIASNAVVADLGCNSTKTTSSVSDFELHIVEGELMEEIDESSKSTYWQDKFQSVYGDMTTFHSFMHEKVQILVRDVAAVDTETRSATHKTKFPGIGTMRRLSTAPDGSRVAHLTMNIEGFLYELVSPVTDSLDTTEYVEWSEEECPAAHSLDYNPKEVLEQLQKDASYTFSQTEGGYDVGLWTSIHINTAKETISNTDFAEDLDKIAGLAVKEEKHSEYCSVTSYSGFMDMIYVPEYFGPVMSSRTIKYVRNAHNVDQLALTAQYEKVIEHAHQQLRYQLTEHWGSNWDHWLDRHIGLMYFGTDYDSTAECDTTDAVTEYFHDEKNRAVGLRIDEGNKYYVGGEGSMTWLYSFHNTCGKSSWNQGVCGCNHANNLYVVEQDFGVDGCPGV